MRPWPVSKVGCSSDNCHAHVRANSHCNHIFCHLLAKTNAGIVAPGNYINEAVIDDDLSLYIRIARQELRQRGPEDCLGQMLGCGDADGAGRLFAKLAERGEFRLDLIEPRAYDA